MDRANGNADRLYTVNEIYALLSCRTKTRPQISLICSMAETLN